MERREDERNIRAITELNVATLPEEEEDLIKGFEQPLNNNVVTESRYLKR